MDRSLRRATATCRLLAMSWAPDVVVIGSGPNGLSAAIKLGRAGFRVLVVEENERRPGGAMGTEELTLPGFQHDTGPAFFPFGKSSPAFREFGLEEFGIRWAWADFESCHVALDGSSACLSRAPAEPLANFGSREDAAAWNQLAAFYREHEPRLLPALLGPVLQFRAWQQVGLGPALKLGWLLARSGRSLAEKLFQSEAARRVLPALALHADVGPADRFGAALGFMLAANATTGGFPVPIGGAKVITQALVTLLERYGGRIQLGERVRRIRLEKGRAVGVVTANGLEIGPVKAVVAATGVRSLFLDLIESGAVPSGVLRKARSFRQGWGTFKLDFALSAAVPWKIESARRSAVVHTGESLLDLERFTAEVRAGKLPMKPYLVVGQQSLIDRQRAPANQHTLYCYTHAPSSIPGGWSEHKERFADTIEERLEQLAPGFRAHVKARAVQSPEDLAAQNSNLPGGDLGGGSAAFTQQLIFRPFFPNFSYRMPIRALYLASSSAHPGGGVHGMCGYNAAKQLIADLS